jgi:S-adenosylmethionine decarboxylase
LNIEGKHIIIDGFDCDSSHLNNVIYLENLCKNAALNAGMEILSSHFYQFQPQGVTGLLLLSTSHMSIHTWPEESYASIDFYTCGNHDPITQVEFLLKGLSTKKAMIYSIARGVTYPQLIKCEEITAIDS